VASTVVFDLDGTLCRPRVPFGSVFFAACAPLLATAGGILPPELLAAWTSALEEPGPATTALCLTRALRACHTTASRELVDRCAKALNGAWARAQELHPGAEEALATLRERSLRIGVVTNGPSDAQRAVIASLGLDQWFEWIIVSGDPEVGVRKPEVGIFAQALAASGSLACETWYIGDSPINDILGASRAGLRTCWLAARDAVLPPGVPEPDARIASLVDLPALLAW
jgi:HAD superfamily hydrolase (TIGR01549 family)